MGTTVCMLAHGEADNLRILLPLVIKYIKEVETDYEIVVVDAPTKLDNTDDLCKEYENQGVRHVRNAGEGFGDAFRTGIASASKEKFLIMDADGSHDPQFIPNIYRAFTPECDVVIGSRYCKSGETHDAKSSQIMSRILNFIYRIVMGINGRDLSTNYRIYHTKDLKAIHTKCKNFDIEEEVLLLLKLYKKPNDFVLRESPIIFGKRIYGESKRNYVKFIISYIRTIFYLLGIRFNKQS